MAVEAVQLKRETLQAFEDYITRVDEAVARELNGDQCFLWTDGDAQRSRDAHAGAIVVEPWRDGASHSPFHVPQGLIHDLVGAAFIPGRTVQHVLRLIQDYDNHKNIYQPEVIDSKLLKHSGNDFQIYLRLLKKKIITVVLDTYHDVHYGSAGAKRAWCRSQSTKVLEVEDAGTSHETRSAPDCGFGFLWRLNSYWRFEAKDGGVFIECRAISLTRDTARAEAGDQTDRTEPAKGVAGEHARGDPGSGAGAEKLSACISIPRDTPLATRNTPPACVARARLWIGAKSSIQVSNEGVVSV